MTKPSKDAALYERAEAIVGTLGVFYRAACTTLGISYGAFMQWRFRKRMAKLRAIGRKTHSITLG